jgi:TonB family protein
MNKALIYRPNNRKLAWIAFACAITVHLGAIAIAANKTKPMTVTSSGESDGPPIEVEDTLPLPPTETVLPSEPKVIEDQEFTDENVSPRPVRPHKKMPLVPVARSTGAGITSWHSGPVKALTLYAPKPNYPYEARRTGTTGTGIAQLTVNSAAGNVVNARMAQSTGSGVLDRATLEALQRWRFKPGVAENVDVPITYTLGGVSY